MIPAEQVTLYPDLSLLGAWQLPGNNPRISSTWSQTSFTGVFPNRAKAKAASTWNQRLASPGVQMTAGINGIHFDILRTL